MLSTNDVGRRISNMSGRPSQDTVDSQGENTMDATDENRIIQPPPAPRRRRVRCLLPMLLAMFVVLVGVLATPVVVFVLDGKGQLPFFGKKNETMVAELSLAAITEAATPKASGATSSSSPTDGPQDRIVGLTTPPRPRSSHASAAGQTAGSRYHAAPHHKPDSNRERVYAPSVAGVASSTTMGATAEVQALSEQVIVLPKGGIMSKLRAASAVDAASANTHRKARHSRSSYAASSYLERSGGNDTASTKAPKSLGPRHTMSGIVSGTSQGSIASGAVNYSSNVKDDSGHPSSVPPTNSSSRPSSHSLNVRHKRIIRNKANRRKRGKEPITTRITSRKGFTKHASSHHARTVEEHSVTNVSTRKPRRQKLQLSNTIVSLELRRRRSTRRSGGGVEKVETTPSGRNSSVSFTLISNKEDAWPLLHSGTQGKLEGTSPASGSGKHGRSTETTNTSAITMRAWTKDRMFTAAPSSKNTTSWFVAANSSLEPAAGATHSVVDQAPNSMSPHSAAEIKPENDTQVGGGRVHSIGSDGSAEVTSKRTESTRRGIKEVEWETNGVSPLKKKATAVHAAGVDASKATNPKLSQTVPPELAPDHVSTDDRRSWLLVNNTQTDHRSLPTDNDTIPNEEETFVDFTINRNGNHDDGEMQPNGNQSEMQRRNYNGELTHHSKAITETSSRPNLGNLTSRVATEIFISSSTPRVTIGSEARHYTGSSTRKQKLIHNGSQVESEITAKNEIQRKEESTTLSSPKLEIRLVTIATATPAAKPLAIFVTGNDAREKDRTGDMKSSTPQKLNGNSLEGDSAGLVDLELNFVSRNKETNKTSIATTHAVASTQTVHRASKTTAPKRSDTTHQKAKPTNHPHSTIISASGPSQQPLREELVARSTKGQASTSTSHATNMTTDASLGAGNTSKRGQATARDDSDDDEDDDDEDSDDEEPDVPTTSQSKTNPASMTPHIFLNFKGPFGKARKTSTPKSTASVTEQRTAVKWGYGNSTTPSTLHHSYSTKRNSANGLLHLGETHNVSSASTGGSAMTLKRDQPSQLANKRDITNNLSHVPAVGSGEEKKQVNVALTATTHPAVNLRPAGSPSKDGVLLVSTVSASTSHSDDGAKLYTSVRGSDDGSIWRTIPPAKNAPSSTTKATALPDSGVGVENYYDDTKNETSSGSAEVDESGGEPKTRNRRISGEMSTTTKSSKKPDVFQTEYYYDDSPSRKTEEPTTLDITELGYESAPEQEAIDDLFF
ncbi:serine-rich adhesin for platelets-like [Dermacentor albipictus]|uniref:serine-rich adhesin for platelets-like n=1 Tax=Dermacentor albipictus TaxID=60249 RepID=UPI0031FD6D95